MLSQVDNIKRDDNPRDYEKDANSDGVAIMNFLYEDNKQGLFQIRQDTYNKIMELVEKMNGESW